MLLLKTITTYLYSLFLIPGISKGCFSSSLFILGINFSCYHQLFLIPGISEGCFSSYQFIPRSKPGLLNQLFLIPRSKQGLCREPNVDTQSQRQAA